MNNKYTKKDLNFKFPSCGRTLNGRSSTIRNAFVNSIIPKGVFDYKQTKEVLIHLKQMKKDEFKVHKPLKCVYCGKDANTWDHFRPTVIKKLPSGYLETVYNLVPCCSRCNSSKRGDSWDDWIKWKKNKDTKYFNKTKLTKSIKILKSFEKWSNKKIKKLNLKIDLDNVNIDSDLKTHWENLDKINKLLKKHQILAKKIQEKIQKYHEENV